MAVYRAPISEERGCWYKSEMFAVASPFTTGMSMVFGFWYYDVIYPLLTIVCTRRFDKFCIFRANCITVTSIMSVFLPLDSRFRFFMISLRTVLFGFILKGPLRIRLATESQVETVCFEL